MRSSVESPPRPAGLLARWAFELRKYEDRLFLVLTLLIGAIVGLVVVAFIVLTERVGSQMYPPGGAPWRRLAVPVAGSLVTGYLLSRFFPDARGSGIPQTKVALFVRGGRIRLRTVLGRFFCSSASLASGIALGREGPSVQIGAGIASVIGQKLGLPPRKLKELIPVGAAAALAAAFNTPIAAVLFSLEEVLGDLHAPLLGSVVLSSATSWVVLHLFLGDDPLFRVPPYHLVHPAEFAIYALLGVAGGLCSVAFVKLTLWMRLQFRRLPHRTLWFQPVAGGLVVGGLGWFVPQVLGVGYDYVGQVLHSNIALKTVVLLIVLKLIATSSCYASGNAGGIFGPSLFLGAMLGGATGSVAHQLLPAYTADAGAYALVGMGATFAGIIRTPLTSVFMIFELTRDYSIVVPLMVSNLISFYLSYLLQHKPIYEALAAQDGIHLPAGAGAGRHGRKSVSHAIESSVLLLPPDTRIAALPAIGAQRLHLIGEGRILAGQISETRKEAAVQRGEGELPVSSLLRHESGHEDRLDANTFPHVHLDQSLELAMERMGALGLDEIAVVDRSNIRHIRGLLTIDSAMRAYGISRPRPCP